MSSLRRAWLCGESLVTPQGVAVWGADETKLALQSQPGLISPQDGAPGSFWVLNSLMREWKYQGYGVTVPKAVFGTT